MNKIKKLPPHEAQKIAAGEVVERPANVLKEILENAIDAQSSKITIHLKDGGKKLIRVIDNGCGMSPEDAQLCFEQHATSKITHVDQLSSINTFGFRGEALASIAAVSKTTLITKEADTEQGTKIEIAAGTLITHDIVHANTGTDITIQDLFYNLPARKKFLKTDETEWHQIQQLFFAFCLAYTHIDFKLYHQEKLVYSCPTAQNIHKRMSQLFDQKLTQQVLPIHYTHKNIEISGLISSHQYERYDRNMIYLFVNQRWVRDSLLVHAFIKGYKQVLPPSRYPAGCLLITVDPLEVDINIHPRKEEVQFLHPRLVQQTITTAVTQALEQHLSRQLQKTVTFKPSAQTDNKESSIAQPIVQTSSSFKPFNFDAFFKQAPQDFTDKPLIKEQIVPIQPEQQSIEAPMINYSINEMFQEEYRLIGQYNSTYILLEQEDGLFMIDQHAAHERVLYEEFIAQHGKMPTVQLMFPHIIDLSPEELTMIINHKDLFGHYGIELEQFGSSTLKVHATPMQLKHVAIDEIIKHAINYMHEYKNLDESAYDQTLQKKLYADMACKAAVKAGDALSEQQMLELIKKLNKSANRFSCPHGRPTSWLLHLDEIKKKFKRDYRQ
jgi:DNA mismatch repair protein MutL